MSRKRLERNKTSLSADEKSTNSIFRGDHPPPFEDEQRRTEFIANVKLRCENILRQVCPSNSCTGAAVVNGVRTDSASSSGNLRTSKRVLESEIQKQSPDSAEINQREVVKHRIGKRADRIMELVRQKPGKQHLSLEEFLARHCVDNESLQDTNHVIKEELDQKTSTQSASGDKTARTQVNTEPIVAADVSYDIEEREVEHTSSERGENYPGHCNFYIVSNEEKKPGLTKDEGELEEPYWRRKYIAEKAVCALASSNQTEEVNNLIDGYTVVEYLKLKHDWKSDKELTKKIAKLIVQEVYARVGCYENFVRCAEWAEEPGSNQTENPSNISVAYTSKDPCEKISEKECPQVPITSVTCENSEKDYVGIPTSGVTCNNIDDGERPTVASEDAKKDDLLMPNIRATCDDINQQVSPLPISQVTCDSPGCDEAMSASSQNDPPIAESLGETSAILTSQNGGNRMAKAISLKRRRRRSGLKTKRVSFGFRKRAQERNVSKMRLTLKQLESEEDSVDGEDETSHFQVEKEKLAPFKELLLLEGTKTKDGEDIVVLNPSKIPSKREFTGRKEYNQVMDGLFLYAQKFTKEQVKTDTFVLTVRSVKQRRSRLRSRKWATQFYKLLKQCYQDRLSRCVLYKPSLKLRALVILSRPFLANDMKEKIYIVKSRRNFASVQGIPDNAPDM